MNLADSIHATHKIERQHIIDAFEGHADLRKRATRLDDCASHGKLFAQGNPPTVRLWIYRCCDRLCPLCSAQRSRKVADQLRAVMLTGQATRHIVLTVRTDTDTTLAESLNHLRTSFAKLRRTPEWKEKISGGAYVIEITRNPKDGRWHPHIHILARGVYFPLRLLSALWAGITTDSMNVWITQANARHANHLAKYAAKPPRLETWPVEAIQEYALATHGARMVQTFGSFHALKLEDSDREPEPAENKVFMNLTSLRDQAAAGQPVAIVLAKAVAIRWPRLWQFLRTAIDIPPPPRLGDRKAELDHAQTTVDHICKYASFLFSPVPEQKKRRQGQLIGDMQK